MVIEVGPHSISGSPINECILDYTKIMKIYFLKEVYFVKNEKMKSMNSGES